MKKLDFIKLAFIFTLLFTIPNVNAQYNFDFGPFENTTVLEFDVYPLANWSEIWIKPPVGHENYTAGHYQTRLLFGGGDVSIYNSEHQAGLSSTNFFYNVDAGGSVKYNFRITMIVTAPELENTLTVEAKLDGEAVWIDLFGEQLQAYGSVPFGRMEIPQIQLFTDNFSAQEVLSVRSFEIEQQVKVYPNPAENIVTIAAPIEIQEVTLFSVTGSLVKNSTGFDNKEVSINIEDLTSGVYFINIETKEGYAVKKMVKK